MTLANQQSVTASKQNSRADFDPILQTIADYVINTDISSDLAWKTSFHCLLDSIACAMLALQYPECTKLLGPVVPGTIVPNGARVPGTDYELDPVQAAFNWGAMIRWLDFNDTWLAAEWGHPSDNLGGILMVADFLSRQAIAEKRQPLTMRDVLSAMIKAHEIQGVLALENSFNRVGLDHVLLVKVASAAVITHMLGGNRDQILNALSQAWVDGQSLRTYRHAPNTGSRKSWAAGDATSRAVRLSLISLSGEMGYPSVLSAPGWGFHDVSFKGKPLVLAQPLNTYVMENVLFKISFPAEFHAQTAVECAITLHPQIKDRLNDIERIEITTHESAMRIINKAGPLHNPADRDHCMQYMVAVALLYGDLKAEYYENDFAEQPVIDQLRDKMHLTEDAQFTKDYLDSGKRSIANSLRIIFNDGSQTEQVTVEYPIGHRRRREEGIPVLLKKFETSLATRFDEKKTRQIVESTADIESVARMNVPDFVDLFL